MSESKLELQFGDVFGLFNPFACRVFHEAFKAASGKNLKTLSPGQFLAVAAKTKGSDVEKIFTRRNINVDYLGASFRLENPASSYAPPSMFTPINKFQGFSPESTAVSDYAIKLALAKFKSPGVRTSHFLAAYLFLGSITRPPFDLTSKLPIEDLEFRWTELIAGSLETDSPESWGGVASAAASDGIEKFAVDLVAEARAGRLDKVVGREAVVRRVAEILCVRRQNNPALLGDAGVGKTAVVEALAQRIAAGDVPAGIRDKPLYRLDVGMLNAVGGVRGELESRLRAVVEEVKSKNAIVFIDEAHTIVGSAIPNGAPDVGNLLKPALARGELRCIIATTYDEYKMTFGRDAALARRFQPVTVHEPSEAECIEILEGVSGVLAAHHGVEITPEAVRLAVHASSRYIPERKQPDKAIAVLDSACVKSQAGAVGAGYVAAVVSEWSGVPIEIVSGSDREILDSLSEALYSETETNFDQKGLCEYLGKTLASERPACIIAAGRLAEDKRKAAELIAFRLFGDKKSLIDINMADFADHHSLSTLKGSASGLIGSLEGGFLTERVRRRPGSVVFARNFNDACHPVQRMFQDMYESGFVRDGVGKEIDFSSVVLIVADVAVNAGWFPGAFRIACDPVERRKRVTLA